jgi:hypothetical protein
MHRVKMFGLALLTMFTITAVVTAMASAALPLLLDSKGNPVVEEKYTGTGGVTKLSVLGKSLEVECEKLTAAGSMSKQSTNGYLGPYTIDFEKCKTSIGGTCTGASEASGVILNGGDAHLVFDNLTTLGAAILFLPEETSFKCVVLGIESKFVVRGMVMCLIKPINMLAKHFELVCEGAKGDPKETKWWNAEGVEQAPTSLETSENGGAFTGSAESGVGLILTELEVKIDA